MPPSEVYITAKIADGFQCSFVRRTSPPIIFHIEISRELNVRFDKNRLAVVWFDDIPVIDFCNIELFDQTVRELDEDAVPSFYFEEHDVSGVIWHGLVNEGTGAIGKLLKANTLSFRIYLDDYTTKDFQMTSSELVSLKQKIMSDILRL